MDVAVVIPLFNGGKWISETLNSVYTQNLLPREVVVVNDASTDESPKIVANEFPEIKLLPNEGKGSSLARNVGIGNTSSSYLAFLDQDDLWHPSHLRILTTILENSSEVDCVVASANCFSGSTPAYAPHPQTVCSFDPWARFPFTVGIEGPSVALFRRGFLLRTGLWQAEGTGMGDILLFLKVSAKGPVLRTTAVTVGKRIHAEQQWLNVRADSGAYMRRRMAVTRLALDFRKSAIPESTLNEVFERRWKALQVLSDLAEIERKDNLAAVPAVATSLEELLDAQVCRHAFYCLMGALFPVHDADRLKEIRDVTFKRLLNVWPITASKTRVALESLIGEQPIVS